MGSNRVNAFVFVFNLEGKVLLALAISAVEVSYG